MGGWVQHETGDEPIPDLVHGHGWADERPSGEDKNFTLDKSGLFLPADAASRRRKVKTGFQPVEKT